MKNDFKKWLKAEKEKYKEYCMKENCEIVPLLDFTQKAYEAGQKSILSRKCIDCKYCKKSKVGEFNYCQMGIELEQQMEFYFNCNQWEERYK